MNEKTIKQSYLIQRLKRPTGDCGVFTFGGGFQYGGLNKEAFDALNKVFSFDYMGAAEFEFGKVQESLQIIVNEMVENKSDMGSFIVHGIPVYYICNKVISSDVKQRIKDIESRKYFKQYRCKESVLLDEAVAARNPKQFVAKHPMGFCYRTPEDVEKSRQYYLNYIGWLELNNHFIFFLEKDIFDKFIQLVLGE